MMVSIWLLTMLASFHCAVKGQESPTARQSSPELTRITPEVAPPGTGVELAGYRLGAEQKDKVWVFFSQSEVRHTAKPDGSGYENANLREGPQELRVIVPDGLLPGRCEVIVEVDGQRSAPYTIEIGPLAVAPLLKSLKPQWAQEGETIWVKGRNLSGSDGIELIDAEGQTHVIQGNSGTSSALTAAFRVPPNLPEGEARVQMIERRSGADLRSNTLSLWITRGPVPVEIAEGWLMPVAPGQWLDLWLVSFHPLKSAERVEVAFKQEGLLYTVEIEDPLEIKGHRVRVSHALSPGQVELRTRTWVGDEVSAWSKPVTYQLLAKPANPRLYSVEVIPSRPEGRVYIGPETTGDLKVYPGEELVLRGTFPVVSSDRLEVILESQGRSLTIIPTELSERGATKFKIPALLEFGRWELTIHSLDDQTVTKLPMKLQVE